MNERLGVNLLFYTHRENFVLIFNKLKIQMT